MQPTAIVKLVIMDLNEKLPVLNASMPCEIILGNQRFMALPRRVNTNRSSIKPLYGFNRVLMPGFLFLSLLMVTEVI